MNVLESMIREAIREDDPIPSQYQSENEDGESVAAKRRLFESSEEISSGRNSVRSIENHQQNQIQNQLKRNREKDALIENSTITISSDNDDL